MNAVQEDNEIKLLVAFFQKLLDRDNFRHRMEAIIPIPSVADYVITSAIRLLDGGHHLKV